MNSFSYNDNKFIPQNSRVAEQQVVLRYVEPTQPLSQSQQQERDFATNKCLGVSLSAVYGLIFLLSSIIPELYGSDSCVLLKKYTLIYGYVNLIGCMISYVNISQAVVLKNYERMRRIQKFLDIVGTIFVLIMSIILIVLISLFQVIVCKNDADCGVLPVLVWVNGVLLILPVCCLFLVCFTT